MDCSTSNCQNPLEHGDTKTKNKIETKKWKEKQATILKTNKYRGGGKQAFIPLYLNCVSGFKKVKFFI